MSTIISRLRNKLLGRDPTDVAAEAVYEAMCTLPRYAEVALECERLTTNAARAVILSSVDDETRAQAVAFLREPKALRERDRRLAWARADAAKRFPALLTYYSKHIPQYIDDWALTFDPRLRDAKLIPFKLYPKQWQLAEALLDSYHTGESLTLVKSRDSGASWLAVCIAVALAIFEDGFTCLIGSQLESKIDQSGTNANTLFGKARMFLEYLPEEFRGGWTPKNGDLYMRLWWPNGSVLFGQAGEAIGRGERASIALLDEYAHLLHPDKIDEALMATTPCKWYISSVNGTSNPFARRAMDGKNRVLWYRWTDDPKKTPEWAAKIIAQDGQRKFDREYGCDFLAGNADQMFKQAWLDAATDAHIKLKLDPVGRRYGGLDVGAGGDDANAFAVVHGHMLVENVEIWPSSVNVFRECERAVRLAEQSGVDEFSGDAVGVGAGLEGDFEQIMARRQTERKPNIRFNPFKASSSPVYPNKKYRPGSKDRVEDVLPNRKSQGYDDLARRLEITYNAITVPGYQYDPNDIVSFSSKNPTHNQLMQELAQITSEWRGQKLYVDKYGDGASPNAADSIMIALAPRNMPLHFSDELLAMI
jgi:phage terminase large subunit